MRSILIVCLLLSVAPSATRRAADALDDAVNQILLMAALMEQCAEYATLPTTLVPSLLADRPKSTRLR